MTSDARKTFELMKEHRVSATILAKYVGTSSTNISLWKNNKEGISKKYLIKIKKYFKTIGVDYDLNYILEED